MGLVSAFSITSPCEDQSKETQWNWHPSQTILLNIAWFGVIFIVLALAGLLLTSPDALTKGLYAFVLGLNAVIVLGSLAVRRLLRRSEEKLNSKKKAAGEQHASIDMWLDKQEGKDS